MQGKILDYNSEFKSGLIRGEDGNKYRFSIDDCKSAITPRSGADVDFEPNRDKAVEVYVLAQNTDEANTIKSEPTPTINPETQKNVIQMVKKIALWGVTIIVVIIALLTMVDFINDKNEDAEVRKLRNGCVNNDAKACYELGITPHYCIGNFNSEKIIYADERNEALAKGCQLGNINACRAGGYYEQGCELKDGKSCYEFAKTQHYYLDADLTPKSVKYYKLACEYGYSQGCI